MSDHDTHDLASDVSGLSSLEQDAEDDFERLIIQNARDKRRLSEALHRRVEPFRKPRAHPRMAPNMERGERRSGHDDVALQSPSGSSAGGSTASDPAIHAPPGWGRKSRQNRNWMRTITQNSEAQQTPVTVDQVDQHRDSNTPHDSVQDSPLSRKSSIHGTPRIDPSEEWDLTFNLNEASMIASTPYVPRNAVLDDIGQREMDSLSGEWLHTRPAWPSHTERTRPLSASYSETKRREGESAQKSSPKQISSWQSIGKSPPVTGVGKEISPIAVYKTAEFSHPVKLVVTPDLHKEPSKIPRHKRQDSEDLLRRLARASNTPSPRRIAMARSHTAPAGQPADSVPDTPSTPPPNEASNEKGRSEADDAQPPAVSTKDVHSKPGKSSAIFLHAEHAVRLPSGPLLERHDADTTPMPTTPLPRDMKTPVVMGAWIDTPAAQASRGHLSVPETSFSSLSSPSSSSSSLSEERGAAKGASPPRSDAASAQEASPGVATAVIRPVLPSSALQALVREATEKDKRQDGDFGDSTIDSLKELITPSRMTANGMDEDTLQGLQLPISTPRTEGERQRQQEVVHLHRMNERLRAARSGIRDASRGMKRVEDRIEHAEGGERKEEDVKPIYRSCSCRTNGERQSSFAQWAKSLLWQEGVKMERERSKGWWKVWGGLTGPGIAVLVGLVWWVSEGLACEMYCHPMYAQSSPHPFSVNMNAPAFPFVLPTLVYRSLIKSWWIPLYSLLSWFGTLIVQAVFRWHPAVLAPSTTTTMTTTATITAGGVAAAGHTIRSVASQPNPYAWQLNRQANQANQAKDEEDLEWDIGIGDDQLLLP